MLQLKISKFATTAFILGVICGIAWIIPISYAPESQLSRMQSEGVRAMRLILPSLLACLGLIGSRKRMFSPVDFMLFTAMVLWPWCSWLRNGADFSQLIVAVVPLTLAFFNMVCLACWSDKQIGNFLLGVGFVCIFELIKYVTNFGVISGMYYGRPRVHFGFDHPLMTAAVIFLAMIGFAQYFSMFRARFIKIAGVILAYFTMCGLLVFADSRNTLVFAVVLMAVPILTFILPRSTRLKFAIVSTPLMLVMFLFFLGSMQSTEWLSDPSFRSVRIRIQSWLGIMSAMFEGGPGILNGRQTSYQSFALSDSLYTTYWLHFGSIGLFLLIVSFWSIGVAVAYKKIGSFLDCLGVGGIFGAMVFFLGDVQGLTPANLAVFLMFSLSYRKAVYLPAAAV